MHLPVRPFRVSIKKPYACAEQLRRTRSVTPFAPPVGGVHIPVSFISTASSQSRRSSLHPLSWVRAEVCPSFFAKSKRQIYVAYSDGECKDSLLGHSVMATATRDVGTSGLKRNDDVLNSATGISGCDLRQRPCESRLRQAATAQLQCRDHCWCLRCAWRQVEMRGEPALPTTRTRLNRFHRLEGPKVCQRLKRLSVYFVGWGGCGPVGRWTRNPELPRSW